VTRAAVLNVQVAPVAERRRRIEEEPLPANIGALLDEAAAAAPTRVAMNFFESGETFTYGELQARVNRLAGGLAGLGIGKGTHVGVMMPNIAAMPTTWLALARLGAVMVPMNIAYTAREVQYVLEDAEVTWLLIHEDCLATSSRMIGSWWSGGRSRASATGAACSKARARYGVLPRRPGATT
jgi:long-chain acyl-CoA synthetase